MSIPNYGGEKPKEEEQDDQIARINKEYNDLHEEQTKPNVMPGWKPPSENPIESEPTQDNTVEEKRSAVLRLIADQKAQREDIDRLNQSVTYIAEKLPDMANTLDKVVNHINNGNSGAQSSAPSGNQGVDPKAFLGELLQSPIGERILDKLMPAENTQVPLIDNATIQEEMKQNFFDNLNTGKSINNFIKDSLKKTVTKKIINTSLGEIGNHTGINNDTHGPA